MLLVADVGNTNTVFGIDDGSGWIARWRVSTNPTLLGNDWGPVLLTLARRDGIEVTAVSAMCICSVVPSVAHALADFARDWLQCEPLMVQSTLALNITLGMENPHQVGSDRIANAAAAWNVTSSACIVVDLGTATKVDAIKSRGVFAGGAIAAGLDVSLEALTSRAAKLTRVELVAPPNPIGRNTTEALQSGIVGGHVHMVSGLIGAIRKELGVDAPVLITGGHVSQPDSPFRQLGQHKPDLTIDGVRLIHALNTSETPPSLTSAG